MSNLIKQFKAGLAELSSKRASDSAYNYNMDSYNYGLIRSIKPVASELLANNYELSELANIASEYLVSEGDWNPNWKPSPRPTQTEPKEFPPTYNRRPPYRFKTDIGLLHVESIPNDRYTSQCCFEIEVYHVGAHYMVRYFDQGNNAEYESNIEIPSKLEARLSSREYDGLFDLIENRLNETQDISWKSGTQEWYQFDIDQENYIKYENN